MWRTRCWLLNAVSGEVNAMVDLGGALVAWVGGVVMDGAARDGCA